MFTFHRLDTVVPPLWESFWERVNPNADDPHIDAATALEHTKGNDPVHYLTRQRIEGDLFVRDLVLERNLISIYDLLKRRSGLVFNTPEVRLLPGVSLVLATFTSEQSISGWLGVGVGATVTAGVEADVVVSITNTTDDVDVLTSSGNAILWAAAELDASLLGLNPVKNYSCTIKNAGAAVIVASGFAILHPGT